MYILTLNTEMTKSRVTDLLNRAARDFGGEDLASFRWESIDAEALLHYTQRLKDRGLKPSTINMRLATVRSVLHQAYMMGLISFEHHWRLSEVKNVKGSTVESGRALTKEEVDTLITRSEAEGTVIGIRNAAVVALAVGCGLRRAEMASLTLSSLKLAEGKILIRGKGNKERWAYLSESVKRRLEAWLAIRGNGGVENVFLCVRKSNVIQPAHPLRLEGFYTAFERMAEAYGVKPFSPHDLRRTYATRLLDKGAPLDNVQKAMGHSSMLTTQRYDRRNREDIVRRLTMMLDE